jgi:hypothetical protein
MIIIGWCMAYFMTVHPGEPAPGYPWRFNGLPDEKIMMGHWDFGCRCEGTFSIRPASNMTMAPPTRPHLGGFCWDTGAKTECEYE